MTFSERFNGLLAERGWTEHHVAAALHDRECPVSNDTVARWINGTAEPRLRHARALADIFGISLDDMVPPLSPAARP